MSACRDDTPTVSKDTKTIISANHKTSDCGGFRGFAKVLSESSFVYDTTDYCNAEKIRWNYNNESKTLKILHTRLIENCEAKMQMNIQIENDTFVITEKDTSDTTMRAQCVCIFDTYSELINVNSGIINISYDTITTAINLAELNGIIIINSIAGSICNQ
jgi:hypothetical protein